MKAKKTPISFVSRRDTVSDDYERVSLNFSPYNTVGKDFGNFQIEVIFSRVKFKKDKRWNSFHVSGIEIKANSWDFEEILTLSRQINRVLKDSSYSFTDFVDACVKKYVYVIYDERVNKYVTHEDRIKPGFGYYPKYEDQFDYSASYMVLAQDENEAKVEILGLMIKSAKDAENIGRWTLAGGLIEKNHRDTGAFFDLIQYVENLKKEEETVDV